jgi:17beta-estradiol 17-dehydrogenase / very-long-chain 3-oxoacyl-CoA reductase
MLLIKILLILIIYQILVLLINLLLAIHKYFLIQEKDLIARYGINSWVVITGGSSGQGADLAVEFAKRKFNILLIGSNRSDDTKKIINKLYPNVKVNIIYKDFSKAYEKDFFNDIEFEFEKINENLALLINNVGYRVGWNPYHDMPAQYINDSIITGTIVQSRLTQLVIPYFLKRKLLNKKSGLINITAQCMHPNYLFGIGINNEISVPYLSVYEGANAFGFYQGNSIYKEYKNDFDILNITPGAVVTGNTKYLNTTIFNIDSKTFVQNIIKLIGNVNGRTCAYWGHAFSEVIINIFPFMKNKILNKIGLTIAKEFMEKEKINRNKYNL